MAFEPEFHSGSLTGASGLMAVPWGASLARLPCMGPQLHDEEVEAPGNFKAHGLQSQTLMLTTRLALRRLLFESKLPQTCKWRPYTNSPFSLGIQAPSAKLIIVYDICIYGIYIYMYAIYRLKYMLHGM